MRLRVQLSSFDAMFRMPGVGVGVAVVPGSAARRNLEPMRLAQLELTDAWSVRERYVLARDREVLPKGACSRISVRLRSD